MPGGLYTQAPMPIGGAVPDVWRTLAQLWLGPIATPLNLPPSHPVNGGALRGAALPGGSDGMGVMMGGLGRLIPQLNRAFDDGTNGVGNTVPGTGLFGTNIGGIPYANAAEAGLIPM